MQERDLALTECCTGDEVDIVGYAAETPLCGRLRELGIAPGVMLRIARGGSPMIVEIGASRLCLRGADAAHVMVRQRQSVFEPVYAYTDFAVHAEAGIKNPDLV